MCFDELIERLRSRGVRFESGLAGYDFERIREEFGIVFPPDLRDFYTAAMPVSQGFWNWSDRSESNEAGIRDMMNWPIEGMIFDIINNAFWVDSWGEKPGSQEKAIEIARERCLSAPKLIPVFGHRFIPMEPSEAGNPVLSVYQTDTICYGENLASYLGIEFGFNKYEEMDFNAIKPVRFWSEVMDLNK